MNKIQNYKTVRQVKKELEAIDSRLPDEFEIRQHNGGVKLLLGETTIFSQRTDSENGTLYKIHPRVNNRGFRDIYGTKKDIARDLSLKEAAEIAELTSGSLYIPGLVPLDADLKMIAKLYFGDGEKILGK